MRILIVGAGGREHALADALARSPSVSALHAAPGNPGIARLATCHPIAATDNEGLVDLAGSLKADLVVIGPEAPLVAGLADQLRRVGVAVFGPSAAGARLEASKVFAKAVLTAAGVATARGMTAVTMTDARLAIAELGGDVVVKADGLAAGKGVIVCTDAADAERAAHAFLVEGAAGDAGRRIVIEERLDGEEVSLLAICDGDVAVPLAAARDYKRVDDDDAGANTGGMGAYSPIDEVDDDTATRLVDAIHAPVLRELSRRGVHFTGCLYAGLMLTADGPRVLEFNTRFGDPEAQVLLPRLADDLVELLTSAATGRLEPRTARFASAAAVGVVIATRDYPRRGENGLVISGVEAAERVNPSIRVYQAGTALNRGALVTAGGRVVCVTALGGDVREARDLAYAASDQISFDGAKRRSDIALRAVGA